MKITSYEDIMNDRALALDLAAEIGRSATVWSRNTWRKRLARLGEYRFRLELYYFWRELGADLTPKNPAAALTRRLDRVIVGQEGGR